MEMFNSVGSLSECRNGASEPFGEIDVAVLIYKTLKAPA